MVVLCKPCFLDNPDVTNGLDVNNVKLLTKGCSLSDLTDYNKMIAFFETLMVVTKELWVF